MAVSFRFSVKKAVEAILYIAQQVPDTYCLLKIMYLADKRHLGKYGRFMCGDRYVAMRLGPVPSGAYDIIKYVRGDGVFSVQEPVKQAFRLQGHDVVPLREPDLRVLSASEIACIDETLRECASLSWRELKRRSHDKAYDKAGRNDDIAAEDIAGTLPGADLLVSYLETL